MNEQPKTERRLGARRKVRMPAKIINPDGSYVDVVIVNISTSGAMLELPYGASISRCHTLEMKSGTIPRQAELVRRNGYDAAIRFIGGSDKSEPVRTAKAFRANKIAVTDLRALVKSTRR